MHERCRWLEKAVDCEEEGEPLVSYETDHMNMILHDIRYALVAVLVDEIDPSQAYALDRLDLEEVEDIHALVLDYSQC
jgi:hypothetical protein